MYYIRERRAIFKSDKFIVRRPRGQHLRRTYREVSRTGYDQLVQSSGHSDSRKNVLIKLFQPYHSVNSITEMVEEHLY